MEIELIKVEVEPYRRGRMGASDLQVRVKVRADIPGLDRQEFGMIQMLYRDDAVSYFDNVWQLMGRELKKHLIQATEVANPPKGNNEP